MFVTRNSFRAFLIALIPLVVFHGITSVIGLAGYVSFNAKPPTPDQTLQILLLRIGIDAGLLFVGQQLLRYSGRRGRAVYSMVGGICALAGYTISVVAGIGIASPVAGTVMTAAIFPGAVGIISGFVCALAAEREAVDQAWLNAATGASGAVVASSPVYDGPVQVRTSSVATLIVAIIPAAFLALICLPLVMLGFNAIAGNESPSVQRSTQLLQVGLTAQTFIATVVATSLPASIITMATHGLARSFRRTRARDYALIGAVMSCLGAIILLPLVEAGFLFPTAAVIGVLMGAAYRQLAGLEPLALPDPILSRDASSLVGADHPARHTHVVIR
jgi:hypothetical protein